YVYVTGYTASSNLPVINALQPNYAGQGDGFVAKFKPDGTPVYITYLGGTYLDSAQDIAVDSAGNAYITGWTGSTDFPTVNAFQPNYAGVWDAFVCKISSDGSTLIYSSYLGGSNQEDRINAGTPGSIAVDSTGAAYVTGDTQSDDFPTLNAYQPSLIGTSDIFITKISPSGSSLVYSTYLGGERTEATFGIAVDSTGVAYVVGDTQSFAYPTANPAQPDCVAGPDGSCWDAIVSVLSSDGSALVYSTYLGGNSVEYVDRAFNIAVDATSTAFVTGMTGSSNFPVMNAYQSFYGGQIDAFVTKYNSTGQMLYSTYLGGTNSEVGTSIALNTQGDFYLTGITLSNDFPTVDPIQSTLGGFEDPFITKFLAGGQSLGYSTYFGGSNGREEWGATGIGLDSAGNVYLAGHTEATDFPILNAYQSVNHGSYVGFISKLSESSGACLFCDDFADGVLDPNWNYIKNISNWSESNDALSGSSVRKTEAHAIPAFGGCTVCYGETVMRSAGGPFNRVWFLFHVQDKNNLVELMMDEGRDRWVLKHRINKTVVAKQKSISSINPNTDYIVRIRYDGTNFIATINGVDLITLAPGGAVSGGSVGFKVKATTGTFQSITVN
ncbi:SBBP repeat-containing protein, partial [bacterium]|nr:SBBP repeat-containing protein [bacterium]